MFPDYFPFLSEELTFVSPQTMYKIFSFFQGQEIIS